MKTPRVEISFNEAIGMYTAEEHGHEGLCAAFGRTPEEAMARLQLAKSLFTDCELCKAERAAVDLAERN